MKKERRTIQTGEIRMTSDEGQPKKIRGYAAVFGEMTEIYPDFFEVIDAGFFGEVLQQDVRVLYNHNDDNLLARTGSKTAKIGVDQKGLWYECDPVNSEWAKGIAESITRGDLSQSSFGFSWYPYPEGYEYQDLGDGKVLRRLLKCKTLWDVGPVTFPAYETTEASTRSLDEFRSKRSKEKNKDKTIAREPSETEKNFQRAQELLKEVYS